MPPALSSLPLPTVRFVESDTWKEGPSSLEGRRGEQLLFTLYCVFLTDGVIVRPAGLGHAWDGAGAPATGRVVLLRAACLCPSSLGLANPRGRKQRPSVTGQRGQVAGWEGVRAGLAPAPAPAPRVPAQPPPHVSRAELPSLGLLHALLHLLPCGVGDTAHPAGPGPGGDRRG